MRGQKNDAGEGPGYQATNKFVENDSTGQPRPQGFGRTGCSRIAFFGVQELRSRTVVNGSCDMTVVKLSQPGTLRLSWLLGGG